MSWYLIESENVLWRWKDQAETIEFFDVNKDGVQGDNPKLENYRTRDLKKVKMKTWTAIATSDIPLPTSPIKL